MTDSSASYENIFSEWLAKQVPPAQFSTIHSVFTNINSFCLSRKILKKPLFETDDLVTLSKVRETVESNKIFAFIYRKQKSTMTAAMQHYYRFIKETKDKSSLIEPIRMDKSKSSEQEISASNSLLDFLVANNISFIDNRQKNGCLWMIGGEELKEFADKCSAYGVTFHFKADGAKTTKHSPAWWTTDDFNNSTKREPTVSVADADNVSEDKSSPTASFDKNNRLKFIEWLDKRGVSSSDIFVVLSSLKRCAERVKAEQIIDDDIYHVISAETMEAICSFLLADKDFINAERCRGDQFTNALNLYLEFFDEQLTPPIAEVIAEPETGVEPSIGTTIPTVSEIEMLLSEEVFSPLKIALAKENTASLRCKMPSCSRSTAPYIIGNTYWKTPFWVTITAASRSCEKALKLVISLLFRRQLPLSVSIIGGWLTALIPSKNGSLPLLRTTDFQSPAYSSSGMSSLSMSQTAMSRRFSSSSPSSARYSRSSCFL